MTQALQGRDRAEEQEEKEGESGRKVRGGSEWEGGGGGRGVQAGPLADRIHLIC